MNMNFESKNKFNFWLVLVLVILNAGTLGILWYGHFQKPQLQQRGNRPDPEEFFIRELNLNQQQAQSLTFLRSEHFKKTDSVMNIIHQLRIEMIEELFSDTPDSLQVKRISQQIGKEQAQFEILIYDHFNDVKQLCDVKYHEKLKQIILDVIKTKSHRPGPQADDRPHPPPLDDRRPPNDENRLPPPQGR